VLDLNQKAYFQGINNQEHARLAIFQKGTPASQHQPDYPVKLVSIKEQ
jgi:hypothetical protein